MWGREDWSTLTEREVTEFSSLELFTCECILLCHFSPIVLTNYTVTGTALSPTLTVSMLAVGLDVSQALFSLGQLCRFTEVRSLDCSNRAPGPTVGVTEEAQIMAWSNPYVYLLTKPMSAKARPISAVGEFTKSISAEARPIPHSDVPQALTLQSQQQGCKPMVPTVARRSLSSSCTASEAQLCFQPHLCVGASHQHLLLRLPQSALTCPGGWGWSGIRQGTNPLGLVWSEEVAVFFNF